LISQRGLGDEPALELNLEQDGDLLSEFINESQEHLQNIEQGVLALEQNPCDADSLNSIFRAFHTFKGGAGFLNLLPIQTLAHELESLLDLARQQKLSITPAVINLILEGGDTLKQFTLEIRARLREENPAEPILVPTLALLAAIRAILEKESHVATGSSSANTCIAEPQSPISHQPSAILSRAARVRHRSSRAARKSLGLICAGNHNDPKHFPEHRRKGGYAKTRQSGRFGWRVGDFAVAGGSEPELAGSSMRTTDA
jgi:chemotaxis protein histidine kinase CheA